MTKIQGLFARFRGRLQHSRGKADTPVLPLTEEDFDKIMRVTNRHSTPSNKIIKGA